MNRPVFFAPGGARPAPCSSRAKRLACGFFLLGCLLPFLGLFIYGCATRTAPTATFLGISPFMSLREARLGLKHQGYIVTTRQDQDAFLQYVFVSRNRGAVFPSVDMIVCKADDAVAGLYFSGDNEKSVLAAGEQQLSLAGINNVDAAPSGMVAKGGYIPSNKALYEDVELSFFRVRGTALWGVAMERSKVMTDCRESKIVNAAEELTLFRTIQTQLEKAGVSSLIDNTLTGNATMPAGANATMSASANSTLPPGGNRTLPAFANATAGSKTIPPTANSTAP